MSKKSYVCSSCGWAGHETAQYGDAPEGTCPRCSGSVVQDQWVDSWGFAIAVIATFTFAIYVAVWFASQ